MKRCWPLALVALLAVPVARAEDRTETFPMPAKNSPAEPLAKSLSLAKTAEFLDGVAVNWTRDRQCGTCHTNYPYLLARPALKDGPAKGLEEVRQFFEDRVTNWDRGEKGDKPRWPAEVVATAATLAMNDARTGKLHPLTRKALDRAWTLQKEDGSWDWLKCGWPPLEHDDYFGAVYFALGVGLAPEKYRDSDAAKEGLAKLRKYLANTPAPTLHHKAWLLWASVQLDGLMTQEERDATVKELLAVQQKDGGWSLASLGDWKGFDGRANDPKAASDGYGTGLVTYVLRQAGVAADKEPVRRGVAWLKGNQRESGRWFTQSLNTDKTHYISHAGTAFAVLALEACGEIKKD
jgi:squalene-hopene/tetraprenyl-beta-curcumene cyclase